ncbi:MAG TPA: SpoIIE family protein phosphatase [Candidatus Polarisedimenticolia bacterium]|nr:SpoIIE family protein phosphatase [Candidatus Polarisedimenticolia bacterium]
MDFLTIVTADGRTVRHDLSAAEVRIGRGSGNDLVLHDLNVSRAHASIVHRPDGHYILDVGGKNGTFLNGRRVRAPGLLAPGDRVRLGTTTLIFNGLPTSPVEFDDRPLATGGGTSILSVGDASRGSVNDVSVLLTPTSIPAGSSPTPKPPDGASAAQLQEIYEEADRELVFHRPLDEILETIMDLAGRAARFERGVLMMLENDRLVPHVVRVPPGEEGRTISISRTVTERVVRHKESVLTADALHDERFRAGQSVEAQQLRSVICVPLWNNREVIGLIYVDSRQLANLFTERDLRLLSHLANVAAVKIEHARLYEQSVAAERMAQELERAAEIQNHLLPSEGPPLPGYALCGTSVSCRAVGGDYFDYITLPGERCAIVLGDVAGKGLPAALLMCSLQASLRALAELDLPPAETIHRLNRLLARSIPANRFVTFFLAVLDPEHHTLHYVNAGHNPPLLARAAGANERLAQTGPPLGLFPTSSFEARETALGPGDFLVCYSDGVTEETDDSGQEFGEERLITLARDSADPDPAAIVSRVIAAVDLHHAGRPPQDDITLVALRRMA